MSNLIPWATAGVGSGVGFLFVKWFVEWVSGRVDKRRDDLDAGNSRLLAALEKRVAALTERLEKVEDDLIECKRMHSQSEAERMRLAALLQGYGDARNVEQIDRAARRNNGN